MPGPLVVLRTFLQNVTVKTSLFLLFVVIVVSAIWIINIDNPPVYERCSREYPEFGLTLHNSTLLENGSALDSNGSVYPSRAFWLRNNIVIMCPCVLERCIKKCCSLDQSFNHKRECTKSKGVEGLNKDFQVYTYNNKSFKGTSHESPGVKVSRRFSVIDTGCANGRMYTPAADDLYLMKDGRLWYKTYGHFFDQSKYCYEEMSSAIGITQYAFCVDPLEDIDLLSQKRKRRAVVRGAIHLGTLVLHCTTLVVFAVTPWLQGGYGKSIMGYVAAHLCRSFINILYEIRAIKTKHSLCIFIALAWDYSWLSARIWLLIVSHQVWLTFRPGPVLSEEDENRRFLKYSAIAWGLPFCQMIIVLATDIIPGVPDILKPSFGKPKCWYNNKLAVSIYFMIPSMVAEGIVFALCFATILRLREYQKRSFTLKSRSYRPDVRQRFSQYLKLFMLLGMKYLVVDLVLYYHWFVGTPRVVWQSAMAISGLRGCEIFFIFALNRNTIQLTLNRPSTLPRNAKPTQ